MWADDDGTYFNVVIGLVEVLALFDDMMVAASA
jgi:hypothetical protein